MDILPNKQLDMSYDYGSLSMVDVEMGKARSTPVANEMNENVEEEDMGLFTTGVVYMICCFSFVISVGAMAISPEPIVFVAMIFPIVLAPYAGFQRRMISNFSISVYRKGIRNTLNKIQAVANEIPYQNNALQSEGDKVESHENELKSAESTDIAVSQQTDFDKLVDLVKENKVILTGMKEMLEGEALADLMKVVLVSKRDKDFKIDPEEINSLILRMKNLNGVDFDEDEFRKILATQELDIHFVMLLVRDMIDDTTESKVMKVNVDKMIEDKRTNR